jgi:subtilisin family serine protease
LLALLLAAPTAMGQGEAPDPFIAPPTAPTVLSNSRVIVEWAREASRADRVSTRDNAEVGSIRQLGDPSFQLVRLDAGQSMPDALEALRDDPDVLVANRDGYTALNSIPNDPLFGELWGLQNGGLGIDGSSAALQGADVNAPAAWAKTIGDPSTVIADIDSGYRFSGDLAPVAWTNTGETPENHIDDDGNGYIDDVHGYDFVGPSADGPTEDNDPTDDNLISGGHGVHTAGTMGAAGNNGIGITGVAQNVQIMPLRVCANSASAGDEVRCPFSSEISAINYAGKMGARAANMSLGGTFNETAVRDAIANHPSTLYVISAGNDAVSNDLEPHYPCNYNPLAEGKSGIDNVICVAATDQADRLASFSDRGTTSVDLGAPGTEILSTFPGIEESFHDDFEANDFSTTWSQSGTKGFGRAAPGDGPLTTSGMNDSPGATPLPNTQYDTTMTAGVAIPAGSGACTARGMRYRNGGSGGSFFYEVKSDGVEAFKNTTSTATSGSAMAPFNTVPIHGLGGHSVKLRFDFTSGPSPTASNGIWLDDLEISCYRPVSAPLDYAFLQGTSMAAPHVTGAAGLLFSLKPLATVKEVRDALLAGVDAVPALAGNTATGGRLDVAKAMESLEGTVVDHTAPSKPVLASTAPESGANDNHPRIKGSAEAGSTVTLFKGFECAGAPVATGSAAELAGAGIEVAVPDDSISFFTATTTDAARNRSACSAAISYLEDTPPEVVEGPPDEAEEKQREAEERQRRIEEARPPTIFPPPPTPTCTVPSVIVGKTLGQAKGALTTAHCSLGKVKKPKARKGHPLGRLVVKSTNPAPGSASQSGKVDLTLAPKPKPKKHHH